MWDVLSGLSKNGMGFLSRDVLSYIHINSILFIFLRPMSQAKLFCDWLGPGLSYIVKSLLRCKPKTFGQTK